MNLKNMHTNRLTLIPITLEITKSLISGSSKEIENLGINNKPSASILEKAGFKEVNRDDELIYWKFIK